MLENSKKKSQFCSLTHGTTILTIADSNSKKANYETP